MAKTSKNETSVNMVYSFEYELPSGVLAIDKTSGVITTISKLPSYNDATLPEPHAIRVIVKATDGDAQFILANLDLNLLDNPDAPTGIRITSVIPGSTEDIYATVPAYQKDYLIGRLSVIDPDISSQGGNVDKFTSCTFTLLSAGVTGLPKFYIKQLTPRAASLVCTPLMR